MTSLHRLIAIAVVWAATGVAAASVAGVIITRFLEAPTIIVLYLGLAAAAVAATWLITRSKPSGS